ncbi:dipeptidyl aminopeptidase/acylaminoacyl peptidase [Lewinella aquimaris]|uniref:Dipeptidyl aminopeptidase/acylaminoacyl peptidase n=1 Tax=Neolewinella aquimaris TaxID=1835722 RepID=A0A840ECA9_9BACT|nr:prolyl oligopeptidase family serine peptidase [Neolewinella aquimaris]MBB4078606.1 dipeptidyl aminopeptidase/acylaminoacyl peptidase [Neolewinella aquimaris]
MKYLATVAILLIYCTCVPAQRAIEVADMQAWKEIRSEQLSADGSHVLYSLTPDVGDAEVVVYRAADKQERRFPRLENATFSYDGKYLVGMLKPTRDTVLEYKRQEKVKELKQRDTLLVWDLRSQNPMLYPNAYDFKLSERSSEIFAYTTQSLVPDSLRKELDKDATRLVVRRFANQDSFYLEGVMDFRVARDRPIVVAHRVAKDSTWTDGVLRIDPSKLEWQTLSSGPAEFSGLNLSFDGERVAFLSTDKEKDGKQPPFHLHYWSSGSDSAYMVTGRDMSWLPKGYRISDDRRPEFSEDGKYLFFGTTPRRPELDSSAIASELADVEVWTTEDPLLYTRQNNKLEQDKKFTYLAVYRTGADEFLQLADTQFPESSQPQDNRGDYLMLYNDSPYAKQTMWEGGPAARDIVTVDLRNGKRSPVVSGEVGYFNWSPTGKYISWYNPVDSVYRTFDVEDRELNTITSKELGIFYDERNDQPNNPYPYGIAGWLENDRGIIVYDRYDLWRIHPDREGDAERLTQGREAGVEYRYYDLDKERDAVDETMLLVTQRDADYYGGFARLDADGTVQQLATGPYVYDDFSKARLAERYLYTRESYRDFPDLRLTAALASEGEVITNANPQQSDFNWGTAEEYRWIDHEGRELRGLLIKPAGFDSTKQYPMLVNFYERSSEGLYRHRTPVPGRSSINYPHYSSRGYVIFNPDVIYREGYPGESAYNCVMSGVSALLMEGFIDKDRIGLQGHSWGGYQAAYLATKTDLFAAIESGAPVVNMFSAYGGIRWGSGLSRQFQYERTQSRIGGTPWEYPLRYLENSPIFTTDKINTPILILHNDEDGAVPWYQGIEWFTALRRLGKPAWFLNYRGEPHWPVKTPNRADFQTRMSQFFDYYLLGAPMPVWMEKGVSPLERGIQQNLELTQEN